MSPIGWATTAFCGRASARSAATILTATPYLSTVSSAANLSRRASISWKSARRPAPIAANCPRPAHRSSNCPAAPSRRSVRYPGTQVVMDLTPFQIGVQVRDIAEARRFYQEVLGCLEGSGGEEWLDFNLYGHQIVCRLNPQ